MSTTPCHARCSAGPSVNGHIPAFLKSLRAGEPTYDPRYLESLGWSRAQCDGDVLDFEDPCGLTLSFDASDQLAASMETLDLNQSNVLNWLQDAKTFQSSQRRGFKMLWTHQLVRNDSLRARRPGTPLSLPKSQLASYLGLPENAIEKLGTDIPCGINFSTQLPSSSTVCYAVSAGTISVLWSYDFMTQTTVALILARKGFAWPHRAAFFDCVNEHKDSCYLPAWLPYIIASTEVAKISELLALCERDAAENGRDLSGFCYNKKPILAFGAALTRTDTLLYMKTYVPFVLRATELEIFRTTGPPSSNRASGVCQRCESENTSIRQLLDLRAQELKSLLAGIESLEQRTAQQVSSILGLISFHQQTAAQELAERSAQDNKVMKEIASATKKDSTSMKVLALMTVIFLPSTATSAIMAIPNMFDFDFDTTTTTTSQSESRGGRLVNPRFWIFFAVALPLTFITMALTLFWLKWEDLGRPLTFSRSAISKFLPPWSWRSRAHLIPSSNDAGKIV